MEVKQSDPAFIQKRWAWCVLPSLHRGGKTAKRFAAPGN
jgi:hypothetical protein